MRTVRADLHNHLKTSSYWKNGDFNRAVDVASRRLGSGGIFGVVNFADKRYETLISQRGYEREYLGENRNGVYVPKKDVYIVKGQEVPTTEGHLLVLGLNADNHLKSGESTLDTACEAVINEGIVVVDHPCGRDGIFRSLRGTDLKSVLSGEEVYRFLRLCSGFEVCNGASWFGVPFSDSFPFGANAKARELYPQVHTVNPDLGAITTSDGHSFYELGRHWTKLDLFNPEDRKGFIGNLKESITFSSFPDPKLETKENVLTGVVGCLDHISDIATFEALRRVPEKVRKKLHMNWPFEVERPDK